MRRSAVLGIALLLAVLAACAAAAATVTFTAPAAAAATSTAAAKAQPAGANYRPDTSHDWHLYKGHWYALTSVWSTWTVAEAEAVKAGGHLATIIDADQNTWLASTFAGTYARNGNGDEGQSAAWIGYYLGPDGTWQWTSDEPVTFTSHYSHFPEGGVHGYLHLGRHFAAGTWNADPQWDRVGASNFKGIIEVAPEAARPDTVHDWHLYKGHWYALTSTWLKWTLAEAEAVEAGGHLATINDSDENIWLTNTFADGAYTRDSPGEANLNGAWIGYCLGPDGTWQWVSGEPVTFKSLFPRFPEGGTHAYLLLAHHSVPRTWDANTPHDVDVGPNFKGIIEVAAEALIPGLGNVVTTTHGDRCVGHIMAAEAGGTLRLTGPQFEAEVVVATAAVDTLAFRAADRRAGADEVALTSGDRISGTLVAITPEHVVLDTPAAGRFTISRKVVRGIGLGGPDNAGPDGRVVGKPDLPSAREAPPADASSDETFVQFANKDHVVARQIALADGQVTLETAYGPVHCVPGSVSRIAFPKKGLEEPLRRKGDCLVTTSFGRFTIQFDRLTAEELIGHSDTLGAVKVRREAIRSIKFNLYR